MNAPEKIARLPYIQSQMDSGGLPMNVVGVNRVRYPMTIQAGNRRLPTIATISMTVGDTRSFMATDRYSSPACYAHEIAPDYFGEPPVMPVGELVGLLNVLLEAERAGAKVLAAFLSDYERDTPAWRQLAAVQRDEAKNCVVLTDLIRRVNGTPSTATGDFLGKALAVEGKVARLHFLNRGQKWVARRISEALPRLEQEFVRDALLAMHESHLLNIEACGALAEVLEA